VLFVLTGSSAAGKSTLARGLPSMPRLAVHDFDELGVPPDADLVWRQRSLELWVRRAAELNSEGTDVLLTGQSPLGEVLACPSTPLVGGVHVCLVDCDDEDRIERLRQRDDRRWGPADEQDFLNWAAWMRDHHVDPQARPEVIRTGGWPEMRWVRWADWTSGDPRWHADFVNTSDMSVASATDHVHAWVRERRSVSSPVSPR
jgi:hypothetical protein